MALWWGWDWDHQSYSREGSGFLGTVAHFSIQFIQNDEVDLVQVCRTVIFISRFYKVASRYVFHFIMDVVYFLIIMK